MKILVCGGRNYRDRARLYEVMDKLAEKRNITMVICGGAAGADDLASDWARERGIHCAVVDALWSHYGRSAGPKRNAAMLELRPDGVVAFPGGKGTAHMVSIARQAGIGVMEIDPKIKPPKSARKFSAELAEHNRRLHEGQ